MDEPPVGEFWLGNPKGGRDVGSGLWIGSDDYIFAVGYCNRRVETMRGEGFSWKGG